MRTANCAINKTERHKPVMATSVREDVAGGSTVIAAACLTTTKRSASSAARASPTLARAKRHQLKVLGRNHLNARRKRMGGSEKGSGSRARPDNNAKLEILKLMDESFVTT